MQNKDKRPTPVYIPRPEGAKAAAREAARVGAKAVAALHEARVKEGIEVMPLDALLEHVRKRLLAMPKDQRKRVIERIAQAAKLDIRDWGAA